MKTARPRYFTLVEEHSLAVEELRFWLARRERVSGASRLALGGWETEGVAPDSRHRKLRLEHPEASPYA